MLYVSIPDEYDRVVEQGTRFFLTTDSGRSESDSSPKLDLVEHILNLMAAEEAIPKRCPQDNRRYAMVTGRLEPEIKITSLYRECVVGDEQYTEEMGFASRYHACARLDKGLPMSEETREKLEEQRKAQRDQRRGEERPY